MKEIKATNEPLMFDPLVIQHIDTVLEKGTPEQVNNLLVSTDEVVLAAYGQYKTLLKAKQEGRI